MCVTETCAFLPASTRLHCAQLHILLPETAGNVQETDLDNAEMTK